MLIGKKAFFLALKHPKFISLKVLKAGLREKQKKQACEGRRQRARLAAGHQKLPQLKKKLKNKSWLPKKPVFQLKKAEGS